MNLKLFLLYFFPKKIREKLKEHFPIVVLFNLLTLFLLLSIFFTISLKYTENVSWIEAVWQVWQTVTTVGYGNQPAATTWGRILTIVIGTMGLALLPAFFAAGFDIFSYYKERRSYGLMKNPFCDGYVIFNFSGTQKILNFVSEIRCVEKNVGVCIVDSRIESLPNSIKMLPYIHFIKGDLLSENTYKQANLLNNKVVIVFPMDPNVSDSDSSTKIIVDLVKRFVGNKVRIIHVLVNPDNNWLFKDCQSTAILQNIDMLAVVQECQDPYSAVIVEKLFSNTEGANPKTVKPNKIIGLNWYELMIKSAKTAKALGIRANIFAHIRNGKTFSCPSFDTIIEKDDLISIMAYNDFCWEAFEKHMVENPD